MGRASAGKKVARAARTGGGRTNRGQTPFGYYTSLVVVVVLGLVAVAFSRYQVHHPPAAIAPTQSDHWYDAFAFDICGKLEPNPPANPNLATTGINTSGNGLISVAPKSSADAGHNATLGRFVSLYPGMELSSSSVQYPGGKLYVNGDRCGAKAGQVEVQVWSSLAATTGHLVKGNPTGLHLGNGQLITIGFVPAGTALPRPSSSDNLLHPTGTQASTTTTTTPKAPVTVAPHGVTGPPTHSITLPPNTARTVPGHPTTTVPPHSASTTPTTAARAATTVPHTATTGPATKP